MKNTIYRIVFLIVIIAFVVGALILANIYKDKNEKETKKDDVTTEESNKEAETKNESENISIKDRKILIAYFSRSGNTEKFANIIHENVGGDIFRIETVNTYPDDYTQTTEVAKQEKQNNARPELKNKVENIGNYDTIFIGYPIWWGTMPMAVYTFLEQYDFSGKNIIPFCTHAGSGLGSSQTDIESKLPNSKVLKGLAINGSEIGLESSYEEIKKWISKFGA